MSEINQQAGKLIGVEVSTSMLKAVCLDGTGQVTDLREALLSSESTISAQLIDFVNNLKTQFGDFGKIGVAVPGLLNRTTKRVTFSANIPEQAEIDFAGEIKANTGIDVVLENDANAAAYGEYILGAGRGSRDIFYVTLGAGVGGALIIDGKLWYGASGFAGEFGYITINSEGTRLEEVASANNIVRRIRNRVHQDNTSSLRKIDEKAITIAHIVEAANNGDDFSQLMLERTGNYVGTGVASVINLLNIEKIVIGGEIMEAENLVLDAITHRAQELSFVPGFEATQIVKGELNKLASAAGVALLSAEA
jgi:glucokinase